jgi:hypothetical protein
MTNREKLRRRIIELIYGTPLRLEWGKTISELCVSEKITIGIVMQALKNFDIGIKHNENDPISENSFTAFVFNPFDFKVIEICNFTYELTKENVQETDLNDQSDETISAIYNLLFNE